MDRMDTPAHDFSGKPTDTVALILAGGRGERLGALTADCAKPALPFGGAYRVIDFSLSNCVNSGIRQVGVLTQYRASSIASHVGRGWAPGRAARGGSSCSRVEVWDAGSFGTGGRYLGTADAVYRNLDNLRRRGARFALVLAGDHVYRMDYRPMIAAHRERRAEVTVACIDVPLADASRYGVMGTNTEFRIMSFVEKPAHPVPMAQNRERALASMGIYLFDLDVLEAVLEEDAARPDSTHDFGCDVIPRLVGSRRLFAHRFCDSGDRPLFWRDVGTPDAYYEANMATLDPVGGFEPSIADWPLHTSVGVQHPVRFRSVEPTAPPRGRRPDIDVADRMRDGIAIRSNLGPGCLIEGALVQRSVLAECVSIYREAFVSDSVMLPGASVGEGCRIHRAIVAAGCAIPPGSRIGVTGEDDSFACEVTPGGVRIVTRAEMAGAGRRRRPHLPHPAEPHPVYVSKAG
jgi:glucose-1-phosphate adenylyltransferase